MRRWLIVNVILAMLIPEGAFAKVDLGCSTTTATSAIGGLVEDAEGTPLPGLKVELYTSNRAVPTADSATTGGDGRYRICAGQASGAGYDTYDVHVRDLSPYPVFATVAQPYTTTTDFDDLDFTPASGYPMQYLTNLGISPNEISTASEPVPVTWTVRSKAPATTTMHLTLGHRTDLDVTMVDAGVEDGGPENGGWNRWTFNDVIPPHSTEKLYWSAARGFEGSVQTTQADREPYAIDNTPPLLGPASAQPSECGPLVVANAFSPASPPGTTNQLPVITHGACDHWSNGARSGIDPFALRGWVCPDAHATDGCTAINPVLNAQNIVWYPSSPLPYGDYYFRWHVADYAGNVTENPVSFKLSVARRGGQVPVFTAPQPGNLGSGSTSGVIVGSSVTSPSSYPYVGFRILDADGQRDLAAGTLHLRVYFGAQRTLVYDYDQSKAKNDFDPVTKLGGANFDLASGVFRADGFPLQGKPPGHYLATASVSDFGGNSASFTWHWALAAAV